jgi:peptidoglycan/LPS O-acetylase OafA/YrhL
VEVTFYASLPLWAVLVRRLRGVPGLRSWARGELIPLALVAAFGILVQVAASRLLISSLFATTLLGECTWLALGMALAVATVVTERQGPSRLARLVAAQPGLCWAGALACLIGATAVLQPGGLFNIIVSLHEKQPFARTLGGIVLTGGLGVLLVAPAAFGEDAGGLPRRILRWRPLAWLGMVSYGVYLYHLAVAQLLGESSDPGHFSDRGLGLVNHVHHLTTLVLFVLTVLGSVIMAALSYYLVELRFLRLKEGPRPRLSGNGSRRAGRGRRCA